MKNLLGLVQGLMGGAYRLWFLELLAVALCAIPAGAQPFAYVPHHQSNKRIIDCGGAALLLSIQRVSG